MDTASQWPHKDLASTKPMEEMMLPSSNPNSSTPAERRATRPHKDPGGSFICPRCNSTNTKFCYYNNYSLSQPRFFCKACRRYWTQGGSLRNIPVGGASRKSSKSITKPSSSSATSTDHNNSENSKLPQQNPSKAEDLNLGFSIPDAGYKSFADMIQVMPAFQNPSSSSSSGVLYNNYAFLPVVGSGFHGGLPEIGKSSSLSFTLDGHGGSYGGFQENNHNSRDDNGNGNGNNNNKILFPFEDLKQDSNTDRDDADQQNGFWNGVLGGGSW